MQNGQYSHSQSYHGHGQQQHHAPQQQHSHSYTQQQQQQWPQAVASPAIYHSSEMVTSPSGQSAYPWGGQQEMSQVSGWPSAAQQGHPSGPYVSPYMMPTPNLPGGMQLPADPIQQQQQHAHSLSHLQLPQQQNGQRMSRPRNSGMDRSRTMPAPRPPAVTGPSRLKSALKRGNGNHVRSGSLTAVPTAATAAELANTAAVNGLGPNGMPNLSRPRTNSRPGGYDRSHQSLPNLSRQNSIIALDAPDHLFLSFNSANSMVVDQLNPAKNIVDPIMETMLPMWSGTYPDTSQSSKFRVRFDGSPWSSQGGNAIQAYRMIIHLFGIFARNGYQWVAQVDVAHPIRPPRQVFAGKVPDPHAHFFVITFSRAGHKLTLVDPPPQVGDTLGVSIRTAFKGQITSDYLLESGVHVVEFKRNVFGTPEADKTVITGYVLKYIKQLGYKLIATVPLARKGMFGLGGRKELWMFQGPPAKRMEID